MIICEVNKNHLNVRMRELLTAGSQNVNTVEFRFNEAWDGLAKTATFKTSKKTISVLLGTNTTKIPWEVLADAGEILAVGVFGVSGETLVLPTVWGILGKVMDAAHLGDEEKEPTPDVYQKILDELNALERPTWDAVQNKPFSTLGGGLEVDENGVLSAQGGGGGSANAVQYVAQELTDEQKAQARENIGAGTSDFDGNYNNLTNKPTIPTAVTIDSTLTQQGQAADAKAVGDELAKKLDNPQTATIGDVLTVEEVDGDGKPTKWKGIDANAILTIDNTGYKGTDYYALPDGVYNLLSLYVANKDGMNLRLQGVTSVKNHSFVCAEKNTNVIFGSDGSVVGYDYGVWRWSEKENVSNKVTSLSATSKDNQYPSAKAVYDALTTAIPKTLPNPHKLTFTGAVTGEYDGSSEMTVDIPQGGDNSLGITTAAVGQIIKVKSVDSTGKPTAWEAADLDKDEYEVVAHVAITEDTSAITIDKDLSGNNLNLDECVLFIYSVGGSGNTARSNAFLYLNNQNTAIQRMKIAELLFETGKYCQFTLHCKNMPYGFYAINPVKYDSYGGNYANAAARFISVGEKNQAGSLAVNTIKPTGITSIHLYAETEGNTWGAGTWIIVQGKRRKEN